MALGHRQCASGARSVRPLACRHPYAFIAYNPRTAEKCCWVTAQGSDGVERVAESSFKATLYVAVDAPYEALVRHGE